VQYFGVALRQIPLTNLASTLFLLSVDTKSGTVAAISFLRRLWATRRTIMTNSRLPEVHAQPAGGDRLEDYHTDGGCMAWRLTEPDARGLFAMVTDEGGTHILTEPDAENLIIGICDVELGDSLMVLEADGRSGLCRSYVQNVGHDRNKEPDGPRPIRQLTRTWRRTCCSAAPNRRTLPALDWLSPDTSKGEQCPDRRWLVWTLLPPFSRDSSSCRLPLPFLTVSDTPLS
jgi:hypothetical protein